MDQGKIEEVVRNILEQEIGHKKNDNISPLLQDVRDSVEAKINTASSDSDDTSLLDNITEEVKSRIG
ncbi:hypothetical protein [Secundilactobacillus collinoides]|uniref:hypothetical protein n=1 Tax=Secundilactobacillus collinoides TaxID=33960 RepID=UPI0006D019C1|nr:hypothetical protein [Secundilactobacillus collinoides]